MKKKIKLIVLADDGNWNPVEWERAAEELTWERVRCCLGWVGKVRLGLQKSTTV